MSDDPFINAVRAIGKGIFDFNGYIPTCFAGCKLTGDDGEQHADDCNVGLALAALKRHDAAFTLAREIYQGGWDTGGPLHIILDDGNCGRYAVKACRGFCDDPYWAETSGPNDLLGKCRTLLDIMAQMGYSEIQHVCERYNEYAR